MVCKIAIIEFIILNSVTFQGFTNNNRCILLLVSDNKITELFFMMDEFYQVFDKIMKKMHQRIGEGVPVIGITPFLRPKSCLLSSFFMIKDAVTTIISIMTRSARIFVFFFSKAASYNRLVDRTPFRVCHNQWVIPKEAKYQCRRSG